MIRQTVASLVVGALSIACAAGAFDARVVQPPPVVEPNPDPADGGFVQGFVLDHDNADCFPDP